MHANLAVLAISLGILTLAGCGGDDEPETVTTHILTDTRFDGDIEQTSPNTFIVTQGMSSTVQSVLVGIDPVSRTEFRAFLDFPLGGSGGVPSDAGIDSAYLEIYIADLQPISRRLPVRVDLVSFQPPTLIESDFSRSLQPALASVIVTPDISRSDVGTFVPIDVTPLMIEAQRRELPDFQVRITADVVTDTPVLMIVDDPIGSNRDSRAPLLTVTYY